MPLTPPSIPKAGRGLFVTGTDTQVGKTTVTAALGLALQRLGLDIGVMKPVETGTALQETGLHNDGTLLRHLFTPQERKELITPYQYEKALAPLEAARHAQSAIRFEVIAEAYRTLSTRHEYMLVEGVGGILAPLALQLDVRDLIKLLQLPCLLVSRTELGTVNHTRLTLEALHDYGIPIRAIVLNETRSPQNSPDQLLQRESSIKLIRQFCPVPIFGPMPFQNNLEGDWEAGVTILSRLPITQDLAAMIRPGARENPEVTS